MSHWRRRVQQRTRALGKTEQETQALTKNSSYSLSRVWNCIKIQLNRKIYRWRKTEAAVVSVWLVLHIALLQPYRHTRIVCIALTVHIVFVRAQLTNTNEINADRATHRCPVDRLCLEFAVRSLSECNASSLTPKHFRALVRQLQYTQILSANATDTPCILLVLLLLRLLLLLLIIILFLLFWAYSFGFVVRAIDRLFIWRFVHSFGLFCMCFFFHSVRSNIIYAILIYIKILYSIYSMWLELAWCW